MRAIPAARVAVCRLSWLWEIPLGLGSFVLFRACRLVLSKLGARHAAAHPAAAASWRLLDGETLARPLSLAMLMTSAPRWNPHAVSAVAGPLEVRRELRLEIGQRPGAASAAEPAAVAWSLSAYRAGARRGTPGIELRGAPGADGWLACPLAAGRYVVAARSYRTGGALLLPALAADGAAGVEARAVAPDANAFYGTLRRRRTLFYRALQYYVQPMLRLRHVLPRGWVERELLPAANPQTRFLYGAVARGERPRLELDAAVLSDNDVFFTLYDRASFPIRWYQVTASNHEAEACDEPGFYLVRIQPRERS